MSPDYSGENDPICVRNVTVAWQGFRELMGRNYNAIMIVAPIFMGVALLMMLGVKRGDAVVTVAPVGGD